MKSLNIKKIVVLGLFISIAVILHLVESLFPYFLVPWARLGLPNIIILLTLIHFGFKEGLYINFIKSILGGFITGTIFNPVFILGITGAITSTITMWISLPLINKKFTLVTISIIGALTHIATQIFMVYLLFFENLNLTKEFIMITAPWFLIFAIPAGFITGMASNLILFHTKKLLILESAAI